MLVAFHRCQQHLAPSTPGGAKLSIVPKNTCQQGFLRQGAIEAVQEVVLQSEWYCRHYILLLLS